MTPYEGTGLYTDARRPWDSSPAQYGTEWEVDLGYDGVSGRKRMPGKKGRAL